MATLIVNNISFSYLENQITTKVIDSLSLKIKPTSILMILGPSGCGKTTLLNLFAGLLPLSSGSISYPSNEKSVGYVFQTPSLLPWLTVLQNALTGAKISQNLSKEVYQKASDLLYAYGLKGYERQYPKSLSGGMQQRVALIRAVLAKSKILLLDEPFSSSDYQMRRSLQFDLSTIVNEEEIIAVMVTHDINEAVRLGDQIIILGGRPSTVKHVLSIDIPRNERLNDLHELKLVQFEHEIRQYLNMEIKDYNRA